MPIDTISTIEEFERWREAWERVYTSDRHAMLFLSWPWLRAHFATVQYEWLVLAFRPDDASPYAAFLPLVLAKYPRRGIVLDRELFMGGYPRADYTGLLALPDYERDAIDAFGRHIAQRLAWDNFRLNDVVDPRIADLVAAFSGDGAYTVAERRPEPAPYVRLPSTWDEYLAGLSRQDRKRLRASIRDAERLPGYRVVHATSDDLDEQIETLLVLHQRRWGGDLLRARRRFRQLFRECFRAGCLYLVSAWDGSTPVASQVCFTDDRTRSMVSYLAGYNPDYAKIGPGRVLDAQSIRDAIERDYTVYDFGHGDEPYKFGFGAETRYTTNTVVGRARLRTAVVNGARNCVFATRPMIGRLFRFMRARSGAALPSASPPGVGAASEAD
jgi:CelD/BcsL family acetyltransferase involved in cellulose biosynthesis